MRQVFLDIGQWCHRKGQCLPQMPGTPGVTQPGPQAPTLPRGTSCYCRTLRLSQGRGGLIGAHRAGPGFWVPKPYPFILHSSWPHPWARPCSAPAVAGLAVAVSQGTAGHWGAGEGAHMKGNWEQELGQGTVGPLSADLGGEHI